MKIDLHIHSTASDGKLSPKELVDLAIKKKISVIAITDHEVMSGSIEAIKYSKDKYVEVVSGIELGADEDKLGFYDVHVIGLFLDLKNKKLIELSNRLMGARKIQKKEIIERLNKLGYEITFEELKKEAGGINYGRPHIARILMRRYDEFGEMSDVFDRLLGSFGKAYIRQEKDTIKNTIDVIHGAGGIVILAHPMFYKDYEKVIKRFVECGGDGMEVDYFYGNKEINKEMAEGMVKRAGDIAKENGLIVSGGGDFHSDADSHEIGDYGVSLEEFRKLKICWQQRNDFKLD